MIGPKHGGIGRYVFELVQALLKTDQENTYKFFYNQSGDEAIKLLPGSNYRINFIKVNSRHYSFSEQTKFLRTLNKFNLDLVHFPNFNAPLLYKRPFVVTIHDMVHHKISGAKKSRLLHFWAYKKVIGSAAQKAFAIITVSEASKKDVVSFLNVPAEKIRVIYEGPSLSTEVNEAQVKKIKNNFFLHRPYFLFVGVLERKKNLINLTRGFDEFLKKHHLDMDLVIVGKPDKHYPEIKYKAMDIKHKDHLVFADFVEDNELAALYRGAYAFITASLHEGFGLPGVEAMQFGLPLLVSNTPVFNEIYDDAAIYFSPLDTSDIAENMHLIVRDKQFYSQMQEKSLKRSQLFDWNKTAQETLEVYRQCLKDKTLT